MTDAPAARAFALVFGIIYIAVGVVGFAATGFDNWLGVSDDKLIIFELNGFHNLVHLGIGAFLVAAARFSNGEATTGVNFGIGAFLVMAALIGFADVGALQLININSAMAADNFLHLFGGIVALAFGVPRLAAATRNA